MKTFFQLIVVALLIVVASVLHGIFKSPPPAKELTKADIVNPGTLSFGHEFKLLLPSKDAEAMDANTGLIPLCDSSITAACLVLDLTPYKDTNLESASIAMRMYPEVNTEDACQSHGQDGLISKEIILGGVPFVRYELLYQVLWQKMEGYTYRTFQKGACYEILTGIALFVADSDAEGEYYNKPDLSEADRATVNAKLESVVNTFKLND